MNKVLPVITESPQYLQRRPRAQPRGFASYGEIQRYLAQEHQVHLRYSEVARFRQPLAQQLRHRVRQAHRAGYTQCRVWAQDESRCGLLPILRRRIAARGLQPVVSAAYRFESLYLYGAVEPTTGQSFLLELPALNSSLFQLFLEQLAATAPAHFHLIVLDNGAFHKARSLCLPPNVGLLFLPPSAPELNPIKRLWRALKAWLAPRQPTALDAFSTFLTTRLRHSTPARVRSLTGFPYFVAAARLANGYSS